MLQLEQDVVQGDFVLIFPNENKNLKTMYFPGLHKMWFMIDNGKKQRGPTEEKTRTRGLSFRYPFLDKEPVSQEMLSYFQRNSCKFLACDKQAAKKDKKWKKISTGYHYIDKIRQYYYCSISDQKCCSMGLITNKNNQWKEPVGVHMATPRS